MNYTKANKYAGNIVKTNPLINRISISPYITSWKDPINHKYSNRVHGYVHIDSNCYVYEGMAQLMEIMQQYDLTIRSN